MNDLPERPLLVPDTSALLGCSDEVTAELLDTGELPGLKFGRSWIVPPRALWHRLDELALQRAAERREARHAPPKAQVTAPAQRGRAARVPPAIPKL
ncbi:MAG: hypothetical protein Q8K24_08970 [Hydrogenophaga sp.]|nr:hypothetical protein [Hydrogenophaga sp.]